MKKFFLLILLAFFLSAGTSYAQEEQIVDPGLLPDHPLYFLDTFFESLGGIFVFDEVKKAERELELSEERLAEAQALVDKDKDDLAEDTLEKYNLHLESALSQAKEARKNGKDIDELMTLVSEATLRHQIVLAEVYEKVPDQAKPAIERAMKEGLHGHEEALNAVSSERMEEKEESFSEQRAEVEQKLEDLRQKGIPGPEITIPVYEGPQGRGVENGNVQAPQNLYQENSMRGQSPR